MDKNICYNCTDADDELRRLLKKLRCINDCCQDECDCDRCCKMYERVYPELIEYLKTHKEYCHSFGNVPEAFSLPEGQFEMFSGGYNTLVLSNDRTKLIKSNGVTLSMEPDETVPRISMQSNVITGIYAMLIHSHLGRPFCEENIFRYTYGLYEADKGASEFELIRESLISFDPLNVPPAPMGRYEKGAAGLDIHISRDKDYVFALHYTADISNDSLCTILSFTKGIYYAW